MKKITTLFVFCAICIVAAFTTGYESLGITQTKMDDEKAIIKVREVCEEYIDLAEYRPIQVSWLEYGQLSNKIGTVYVTMIGTDNEAYSITLTPEGQGRGIYNSPDKDKFTRDKYEFNETVTVKWSDMDPKLYKQHIDNAIAEIPTDEYKYESINEYKIRIDQKTGKLVYEFSINITEKGGNSTEMKHGRKVTTYYEIKFIGNPDGSVELKE